MIKSSEKDRRIANMFFSSDHYKKIRHKSGLTVVLHNMPDSSYAYGVVGVRYGSINSEFKTDPDLEFTSVPHGIAHFLEHKMFENEDGEDTFQKFARTGAVANAYTGFDQTGYLFSCSENFRESLEILIDYITHPYFTHENVEKEKGIIGQEIKMCQDDPHWRCYFGVIRGLYSNIPIIYDIAGTVDSISKITPELLYECYNTFYNLNNMVLSIAGNFDVDEVISVLDKFLPDNKIDDNFNVINKIYDEPVKSVKQKTVENLPVEIPLINIGFKHTPFKTRKENFILNIKLSIIGELIAGSTSDFYKDLYYGQIVSRPIGHEVSSSALHVMSIFSLETKHYQEVEEKLFKAIEKIKQEGIDPEELEDIKNGLYGKFVMDMDNPEEVATNHMDGFLDEVDFLDWQDVVNNVTKEELEILIQKLYNKESSCVCVIESV